MSFHIDVRACVRVAGGWVGARIFEFCDGGEVLFFLSKQMSERKKGKESDRKEITNSFSGCIKCNC